MTDLAGLMRGLADVGGEGPARLLAVGWATVDLERTLADLGAIDARPAEDEPLLGARAWRVDLATTTVLVLEPTTEGRLAAALARRGEGICALYLASEGDPAGAMRITALGLPGRLLPPDAPWGPFVIEVVTGQFGTTSVPRGASTRDRVARRP